MIAWYEPIARPKLLALLHIRESRFEAPLSYSELFGRQQCASAEQRFLNRLRRVALSTRTDDDPENSTSANRRVMSRDRTGVTVASAIRTVCSSRPLSPATGTTRTSDSATPATVVTLPTSPLAVALTVGVKVPGAVDNGTIRCSRRIPRCQLTEHLGLAGLQQRRGRQHSAGEERNGSDRTSDLLHHDRRLTRRRTCPAQFFGYQQSRQTRVPTPVTSTVR